MASPSDTNPDAMVGAAEPTVERIDVEGHGSIRGTGDAVWLTGAADEDAEVYRGIAERLAALHTVITYDRRGTGRGERANWPSDSVRHAADAAALSTSLRLKQVVVLGASAGGIVALRLALRHPEMLRAVLCFEPGISTAAAGGEGFRRRVEGAVDEHLRSNPSDWQRATDQLGREAVRSVDLSSLFTPPPGEQWFVGRTAANADSLIRGDLRLTGETFSPDSIADCTVSLRFSRGTSSLPVFGAIAAVLAALRNETPDVVEGANHSMFYHPDQAAEHIVAAGS